MFIIIIYSAKQRNIYILFIICLKIFPKIDVFLCIRSLVFCLNKRQAFMNFLDKQQAQLMELDLQLSKADFGEDYTPTEAAVKLKTQLALDTKLPPEIKVNYRNKN